MSSVVTEARGHADAATRRARDEGWPRLAEVGERVGAMVDRCPERMLRLVLGMSV